MSVALFGATDYVSTDSSVFQDTAVCFWIELCVALHLNANVNFCRKCREFSILWTLR